MVAALKRLGTERVTNPEKKVSTIERKLGERRIKRRCLEEYQEQPAYDPGIYYSISNTICIYNVSFSFCK